MDTHGRVELVTDAVVALVNDHGVEALTVRRIAERVGISPSSLTSHLTSKRRIIDLTTKQIGRRLTQTIGSGLWRHRGVPAFVPDPAELEIVRAWLAMVELSRSDAELDAAVRMVEADLGSLLDHACFTALQPDTTALVLAVIAGLWAAACRPDDPLPVDRARQLLVTACDAFGVPLRDDPAAA